jgi:hypothetical protein
MGKSSGEDADRPDPVLVFAGLFCGGGGSGGHCREGITEGLISGLLRGFDLFARF